SMGRARPAGARGRRYRCVASWSWPLSSEPVEDALEPLPLLLGRFAPDRARRHVVDELLFLRPQPAAVSLAPQGDLVPWRRAVDVGEVRRALVLGLRGAQAGVITGVVELAHLGFGEGAAVRLLNALGERVDVQPLAAQGALDGARGRDHIAVAVGREHADHLAELAGDGREVAGHGLLQHRSRWPHALQRQSAGSSYARGNSSPTRVASIRATARSDQTCACSALNGTKKWRRAQVLPFTAVKIAGCSVTSR